MKSEIKRVVRLEKGPSNINRDVKFEEGFA